MNYYLKTTMLLLTFFFISCFFNLKEPLLEKSFQLNNGTNTKETFILYNIRSEGVDIEDVERLPKNPHNTAVNNFLRSCIERRVKYDFPNRKPVISPFEPEMFRYLLSKKLDANFILISFNEKVTWYKNPMSLLTFLSVGILPTWSSFEYQMDMLIYDQSGQVKKKLVKNYTGTMYNGILFLPFASLFDYSNFPEDPNMNKMDSLIIRDAVDLVLNEVVQAKP